MRKKIISGSLIAMLVCLPILSACAPTEEAAVTSDVSTDQEKAAVTSDVSTDQEETAADSNVGTDQEETELQEMDLAKNAEGAANAYSLAYVHQVNGRQGVCAEGNYYWVSGSTTLTKYDKNWNVVVENADPFKGYELEVNHIGDIDVYQNELYLGVEYFMDGVGKNIQVAVYDGDTLELKRVFPFSDSTGQLECAGIAVDPDSRTVYMVSWIDDESSNYLYMYDLDTGDFKGKLLMENPPKWLQGVAYYNGSLYVTADDGDADKQEPDHMYRIDVNSDYSSGKVSLERTFDDVVMQGEIEGLCFDKERDRFLLLYNHGARIVLGMPKGFYDGFTEEIHEVYVYDISDPAAQS